MTFDEANAKAVAGIDRVIAQALERYEADLICFGFDDGHIAESLAFAVQWNEAERERLLAVVRAEIDAMWLRGGETLQ